MITIKVEASRCPQNHTCPVINICPEGALSQKSPFSAPEIDEGKCAECGLCLNFCGYGALLQV
jgi:Fe-S-cluster-containing hydrogenase component 2